MKIYPTVIPPTTTTFGNVTIYRRPQDQGYIAMANTDECYHCDTVMIINPENQHQACPLCPLFCSIVAAPEATENDFALQSHFVSLSNSAMNYWKGKCSTFTHFYNYYKLIFYRYKKVALSFDGI